MSAEFLTLVALIVLLFPGFRIIPKTSGSPLIGSGGFIVWLRREFDGSFLL